MTMTQPDDLTVLPDAITVHSGQLDAVADQAAIAHQAGRAIRVDQNAYGQLCTVVPLMVNALQDLVLEAIDTAADSLNETAQRLRTVAANYQNTDDEAADGLRRLQGDR